MRSPALTTRGRQALSALGASVDWREYPMAHQADAAVLRDLRAWISARLPADPPACPARETGPP